MQKIEPIFTSVSKICKKPIGHQHFLQYIFKMESIQLQQFFFQHIKSKLPPHLSFVDEVAEHLNISTDSAYRRIRGEKPISLEEVQKLCSHFRISLDHLLNVESDRKSVV